MKSTNEKLWLPEYAYKKDGNMRRVGVEIELAGLAPIIMIDIIKKRFGGQHRVENPFVYSLEGTSLGDFQIELDADAIKSMGKSISEWKDPEAADETLGDKAVSLYTEVVQKSAELVVPWEIVSPPITIRELEQFNDSISDLRRAGALGTKDSVRYAFGVHLNPELPALDAETILHYFQAYLVMHEWLEKQESVSFSRKLSPYIRAFDHSYVRKVLDADYSPDLSTLIDDYLEANPTRNRCLDMLPLFAHIDEQRVRSVVEDPRVKARPTLHYRLPNCDIDNPDWSLKTVWDHWLKVEELAHSPDLPKLRREYLNALDKLSHTFTNAWVETIDEEFETPAEQ